MAKPYKAAEHQYDWYKKMSGDAGSSHGVGSAHWLAADVFDRLAGGLLMPIMGIRRYASEEEAMTALRKAG